MDFSNLTVGLLVVILLVLAVLFMVVRSFKLPASYFKNQKARNEIRTRLLEKEYEEKQMKSMPPPEETGEKQTAGK